MGFFVVAVDMERAAAVRPTDSSGGALLHLEGATKDVADVRWIAGARVTKRARASLLVRPLTEFDGTFQDGWCTRLPTKFVDRLHDVVADLVPIDLVTRCSCNPGPGGGGLVATAR